MSGLVKDPNGYLTYFDNNNYVAFKGLNFGIFGSSSLSLSVAVSAGKANQTIDIRLGSTTGISIGKLIVAETGSWTTFTNQRVRLNQKITGTKDIYFVGVGSEGIANFKAFKFVKIAPPSISFTSVPANNSTLTIVKIDFRVVTSSASRQIQCAYDSTTFKDCTSPVEVVSPVGLHKFQVKAVDLTNNLTTTASYSWAISRGDLPYINLSLAPPPEVGTSLLKVSPTTEIPPVGIGAASFRIECGFSHMANNDPIVFPGKTGASHHHTFFGNTSTNAFSTNASIARAGNTTCNGGIMNRSSYWVPSMIDTARGAPIKPLYILVYYKTPNPAKVTVPPPGLRMIVSGSTNTTGPSGPNDRKNRYTCNQVYETRQEYIPNCLAGETLDWMLVFPDCWNGINLDSADHKSHMAFSRDGVCPTTHPVLIPQVSYNVHYPVGSSGTSKWRLASDHYPATSPGGYSGHGDWMNGWDPIFMKGFVKNCLQANKDCHAHLLGDGRMFYK